MDDFSELQLTEFVADKILNVKEIRYNATVKKILTSNFKKPKTKIQPKALEQMTKILNIAIVECSLRAGKQAFAEDSKTVTKDTVQKILPQMILDI